MQCSPFCVCWLLVSPFRFHVLFVVSLLVVVVCEVISIMGKASSKPKGPLKLFLSHFWDFKEPVAVSAGSAAL